MLKQADKHEPNSEERQQIDREREKLYLQEVSTRYAQAISRLRSLDPLFFSDPQLEEGTRCYLYGFNRAAITCAAAAVETHLKRRTGIGRFERYDELVDRAFWAGLLDSALREAAMRVFRKRNDIVHGGLRPPTEDAAVVLDLARKIVEHLHGGGARQ